mgnify:CR=1 FL=1
MTAASVTHLANLARSLAAHLPRDQAMAGLLEAIAACHPGQIGRAHV